MGRKKLPSFDERETVRRNSVVSDMISMPPTTEDKSVEQDKSSKKTLSSQLLRKTYYITEEQHQAIRKYAFEKELDMSFVVREALDAYFFKNEKKSTEQDDICSQ